MKHWVVLEVPMMKVWNRMLVVDGRKSIRAWGLEMKLRGWGKIPERLVIVHASEECSTVRSPVLISLLSQQCLARPRSLM